MITFDKLYHKAEFPWQYVNFQGECTIMLRVLKSLEPCIQIVFGDPCDQEEKNGIRQPITKNRVMNIKYADSAFSYYVITFFMETHKLRYYFRLKERNDNTITYSESGICNNEDSVFVRPFFIPYTYLKNKHHAPDWVSKMVWYQIFPERFCDIYKRIKPKDFIPHRDNFFGGNLKGIIEKIPYIKQLEVTGIYLNPIFASSSNHKYDTINYYEVDREMGTTQELIGLVELCHNNQIKVMLDGVFNHCGYDSPIWKDVVNKGIKSVYYNWFIIYDVNKIQTCKDCEYSMELLKCNPPYETFAFAQNMPKWNTQNPEVIEYLIGIAEYWTKLCDIDGWRLDVPDEISEDFLRQFRRRIKEINPDIYIIGEIWHNASHWLQGDMFDGVMNYEPYFTIRDFSVLREIESRQFTDRMMRYIVSYPKDIRKSMFNFCGNHDIPRITTLSNGNMQLVKQAYLLMFSLEGGASVYYGDEISIFGGEDPDNRRAMEWDHTLHQKEQIEFIKKLSKIKQLYTDFFNGEKRYDIIGTHGVVISMEYKRDFLLVYANNSDNETIFDENVRGNVILGNITAGSKGIQIPPTGYGLVLMKQSEIEDRKANNDKENL